MVKKCCGVVLKILKVIHALIYRVKCQHNTWIQSREYVISVVVLELKEQRVMSDTFNYKIIICSKHIHNEPQHKPQPIYTHIT